MNGPSGIFTEIADKVLRNVETFYAENGSVSDDILLSLYSVFGDVSERALTLLDSGHVVLFTNNVNNAKIFQVTGSSGMIYTIFPEINFCHCIFYTHQANNAFTCKHVLAARLAHIMGLHKELNLTNEQFVKTLMDSLNNKGQEKEETCVKD